jgi:hypothetical protein
VKVNAAFPLIRARHESHNRAALRDVLTDQEAEVLVAGRPLGDEWDARLATTIYTRNRSAAADVGGRVAAALRADFDPDVMDEWLTLNADFAARGINDSTRRALEAAQDDEARQHVYDVLLSAGVAMYAASMVTTAANFGALDAAAKAGGRTKTWHYSGSPQSRHGAMDGETVPIEDTFSNGLKWPGDPQGDADDIAGCQCTVSFEV